MNCHIPVEHGALEYTSVDEAIDRILSMDRGCILVKRDLAEVFRHIPVSEADWWLFGFSWDDNQYQLLKSIGIKISSEVAVFF